MIESRPVAKLAFVSYEFSERIIGGSIRSIGFARNLPQFGWEPYIITASDPTEQPPITRERIRYVGSPDKKLSGGIKVDHGDSVLRAPRGLLRLLAPLKRLLPLERQLLWLPALRRSVNDAALENVEVVLSTVAPYTSLATGHWLARRYGVPHVVDLRDDWQDRFRIENRSWINRVLLDKFVLAILRKSAAVLVVSPLTYTRLKKLGVAVHLVYNGFDESDFADVSLDAPTILGDGPVTVLHAGWLGEFRAIGPVLEAMEAVATERDPSGGIVFRFRQMGLIDEQARATLARSYRGVEIEIVGQQNHRDARDAMLQTDLLLAIPGDQIPAAVSGKLFEYARSRRPTLLVAREGAARDVARTLGMRFVADPGDKHAIASMLMDVVNAKRAGTLKTHSCPERLASFTRQESARKLAAILDSIVDRSATTRR